MNRKGKLVTIALNSFGAAVLVGGLLAPDTADAQSARARIFSVQPLSPGDRLLVLERAGAFDAGTRRRPLGWSVLRARGETAELFEVGIRGQAVAPGQVLAVGAATARSRNGRAEVVTAYELVPSDGAGGRPAAAEGN